MDLQNVQHMLVEAAVLLVTLVPLDEGAVTELFVGCVEAKHFFGWAKEEEEGCRKMRGVGK